MAERLPEIHKIIAISHSLKAYIEKTPSMRKGSFRQIKGICSEI